MIRRLPLVPTLVVFAAAAAMVGLGVWQLQRRVWKEHLLATYAANAARPPVAFVGLWPVDDGSLFRRASANCLDVTGWRAVAGHDLAGRTGYRHLALCRTGAEGPGFAADIGLSQSPDPPAWRGGVVRGRVSWLPSGETILSRLFGSPRPETPMIVAETPASGLAPSGQPDPAAIPNNHLAYAMQWFIFATLAIVIYLVALARRERKERVP